MQRIRNNQQYKQFRTLFRDPVLFFVLLFVIIFIFVAILMPIMSVVGESVSEEGLPLFYRYLSDPVYQAIIWNTLVLGTLVGIIGTAVGFLFAFVQVKLNVPFKRFMHIIALVPVISPPFALATSAIVLFGRNGTISRGIFGVRYDIYGLDGLVFVMTLSFFTITYLNMRGMMEALDPALDEAAINLGANRWRIFRTVTIPMLLPGIASSFLLLFVEAIADLGNPLVLAGNYEVLATRIYVTVVGLYNPTGAAVLSVILLVPALLVYLVQRYWIGRKSVVSVTGKPAGTPQTIENPFVKWGLFAAVMFVCLLVVMLYGTILHGAFVTVPGVRWDFTLDHFDFVINGIGSQAMRDTTVLSGIATPLAAFIGILIAYIVIRKQIVGGSLLDFGAMLGVAVPGTIIGIGYILAFNTPVMIGGITIIPKLTGGQAAFGGALAIVLVYIIRSVPAALRSGTGSLSQIDPAIEEASISLGADTTRTFRKITLPLIRPALFAGLVYAFARSMTTISAIVFLTTPQTKIMTQQILNEVENGRYGNAYAYCVILVVIVLAAIGIFYALLGTKTGAERRT